MSNNESGRRGVGRPGGVGKRGGSVYRGKCDVRLSAQQDLELTRLAERYGVARSDIVRRALRDFIRFNSMEDTTNE